MIWVSTRDNEQMNILNSEYVENLHSSFESYTFIVQSIFRNSYKSEIRESQLSPYSLI